MTFQPFPSPAGRRALLAAGLLIGIALLLAVLMLALPVGGLTFALLLVFLLFWLPIIYLLWRAWATLTLRYWLDRNELTLAWGPLRQIIPLGNIQSIRRGEAVAAMIGDRALARGPNGQIDGVVQWLAQRWPRLAPWLLYGEDLGTRRKLTGSKIYSIASQPLPQQLLLYTTQGIFGISPADPAAFLASLEQHHQLGPTHLAEQRREWPAVMRWPLWQDRFLTLLLAAGVLGALLLLGVALSRFTTLPFALPQWDNLDRRMIFLFPAFGLAVWLVNGIWGMLVYQHQRIAAALLWGGALLAQGMALAALLAITRV